MLLMTTEEIRSKNRDITIFITRHKHTIYISEKTRNENKKKIARTKTKRCQLPIFYKISIFQYIRF